MTCRFCETGLTHVFVDLYNAPPSNAFLKESQLNEPESFFPLKVYVCHNCLLVQVDEYEKSEAIFNNDYVYFSSYSTSWLQHSKVYTEQMIDLLKLNEESKVIEIASNDGYLLQYFKKKNIPVLGIEPTENTAKVSQEKGIENVIDFFGVRLAKELSVKGIRADLLLGNNVLAHVPDIKDFVSGLKILLKENGVITMEFPHLLQLIEHNQFDTIYHEHFSYLSFVSVKKIFESSGLKIIDVQQLPTHGGSLRIFATHSENSQRPVKPAVKILSDVEEFKGMLSMDYYANFQKKAFKIKVALLKFLLERSQDKQSVAAYGAAAKGNTLLNYCGVKQDLIQFVADANPHKQNKFLPGSHIPVVNEDHIRQSKPEYLIILPWNLKDEITTQLSYVREWGCRFVIAIPELQIF